MRSKVVIPVFLALAMLLSFGVAEKASADSIMFPWLVKSNTVFSLVSVVNTSATSGDCETPRLHYQYYFKDAASATVNTDSCAPQSFYRQTSQEDIVSFDASGAVSLGAALFDDQPALNGNVTYVPSWFFMNSAPVTARAFLLVDNNDTDCFEDADWASLYGEAMIIQISQGSAWGYVAYNGIGGGPYGPASEPELGFNDDLDLQGEVMRSPRFFDVANSSGDEIEVTPTVLLPLDTFHTKMFVTPVNYALWEDESNVDIDAEDYAGGPGARTGSANSRIQFCLRPYPQGNFPIDTPCPSGVGGIEFYGDSCQSDNAAKCEIGGIYDNDEGPLDSNLAPNVVCTAALDVSEENLLLTAAQIAYLESGAQGWTYVRSMVGSFLGAGQLGARNVATMSDSIIGKLDYTESNAGFQIGNVTVNGTVNDMKWIRNSASQYDGDWDMWRGINAVGSESWTETP